MPPRFDNEDSTPLIGYDDTNEIVMVQEYQDIPVLVGNMDLFNEPNDWWNG